MSFRIGHGYDVHELVCKRPLIIGGVQVPYDKGLAGHSDADVLTHAIIDSILGAVALGDIGSLFPDNDVKFKNADSLILLKKAYTKVAELGYAVVNIDATIVAQNPKMNPHIPQMKENLAKTLKLHPNQINIKATTEEHLGFTGKGLGIAAHAVCLLEQTKSKE